MRAVRLASGSDSLALSRVAEVERRLKAATDPCTVHGVVVEGRGDAPAGLEDLLPYVLNGQADAIVCSASEVRLGVPHGLSIVAVLREHDPRYRCVSRGRATVCALPAGSAVVVIDVIARAQVRNRFPHMMVDLVQQHESLIEGLRRGVWAAACLPPDLVAIGPLWGLDQEPISIQEVMPAVGQGSIVLLALPGHECPAGPALDEAAARACLAAESAFLRQAVGVPGTAATAAATVAGEMLEITGLIAEADGAWLVTDEAADSVRFGDILGREIGDSCREMAWVRHAERAALQRSVPP